MPAEGAALVVQRLCGRDRQVATGNHTLARIAKILRAQADIAIGVAAVIGIDPGFDDAVVGQLAAGTQGDAVAGGEGLLVGQVALGLDVDGSAGVNRSARIKTARLDLDRAAGRSLDHAQLTIGVELNVAAAGDQFAVELHPDPGFGAHQFDRPGVHPAQRRRVDGQLRFGAAVIGAGRGVEAVGVDVVTTGNDGQVVGLNFGVDFGAASDDFEAVDVIGVQPGAVNGNAALIHLKTVQATIAVEYRFAGGQRHARSIDETAAVAADAIRVSHDHAG
ncbi:hypothetical protein D3C87_1251950 [compost metagenome]